MASYHDTELLITEIQKRPELWNCSLDDYKNKIMKNDAWNEICVAVHPEFELQDNAKKQQILQNLQARWKSIRDSNTRSRKKNKGKSGSRATKSKKYVFADHLAFLQTTPSNRETEDSLETQDQSQGPPQDEQQVEVDEDQEGVALDSQSPAPAKAASSGHQKQQSRGKKRNLEDRMMSFIDKCDEQDEDRDFFNSLLPSVKKLNEDQKLLFRVEVIRALQAIKAGGQTSSMYQNMGPPSSMPYANFPGTRAPTPPKRANTVSMVTRPTKSIAI